MKNNYNQAYLTLEERALISKLRDKLDDSEIDYNEEKYNENYLIRFLVAEKYNVDKAFKKFTKYLNWYNKYAVGDVKDFRLTEIEEVNKYYKTGFHKCDKLGRPIYIEIFEEANHNDLFKVTTSHERLNTYYIQKLERMFNEYFPACSEFHRKYIYQMCIIMDLRNLNFTNLNKSVYNFVEIRATYDQSYYPEMLGQLVVINNSQLIKTMWAICSGFIDEKTKKKVKLCSEEDYKDTLKSLVDMDQLPIFFGGSCDCTGGCLNSNEGPWKK